MADKSNETWINFAAADLVDDQREAYEMLLEAKRAFEATFPVRDGFELRFSYKGADFSRMGFCELARSKSKDEVKTNLAAWLAARKAAGDRH